MMLVLCRRLSARIQPAFCRRYRENNQICARCEQAPEMDRMADADPVARLVEPVPQRAGGAEFGKRKGAEMKSRKPTRACADCGQVRVIQGRGKCGTCYHRELRREARGVVAEPVPVERLSDDEAMRPIRTPGQQRSFASELDAFWGEMREVLISKNQNYGDSALNPVRVFSKADAVEQIRVRLDDKLSRLMRGADAGEDTELDLLGYLVLLRLARRRATQ